MTKNQIMKMTNFPKMFWICFLKFVQGTPLEDFICHLFIVIWDLCQKKR